MTEIKDETESTGRDFVVGFQERKEGIRKQQIKALETCRSVVDFLLPLPKEIYE